MRDGTGARVLKWVGRVCWPSRRHQSVPRRECWYRIDLGAKWLSVQYLPFRGFWAWRIGRARLPNDATYYCCPRVKEMAIKRRQGVDGKDLPGVPLPAISSVLMKLSLIREFITAVSYDDHTKRQPGYLTLRNRGSQFEVTLYDPDAGMRLPCRASLIDDAFALAEKLLGTEDAPWEVDDYLTQRITKTKKKK